MTIKIRHNSWCQSGEVQKLSYSRSADAFPSCQVSPVFDDTIFKQSGIRLSTLQRVGYFRCFFSCIILVIMIVLGQIEYAFPMSASSNIQSQVVTPCEGLRRFLTGTRGELICYRL